MKISHTALLLSFLAGTLVLGGCGGGSHSAIPTKPGVPSQGDSHDGTATMTIKIPRAAAPSSTAKTPAYVSPATTQMVLDIQQGGVDFTGYPQTVGLTPTSAGCTSTLATLVCDLNIALPPGSYTATLTMEDASNTPLSAATAVGFTISAGVANTIPITLSGIPAQLLVAPQSTGVHGSQSGGLTVYGNAAQNVIVNALDADGNIIAGPGSPTYALSVVGGSGATWTPATPSPTSPNLIAITPPGSNGASAQLQLTASFGDATCSNPSAVCTTLFSVKNTIQRLYVFSETTDGANQDIIHWYDLPLGTGSSGTVSAPVTSPQMRISSFALAPNGEVYVIECNQGCNGGSIPDQVGIFDRDGNPLQTVVDPGTKAVFNNPVSIAVDAHNDFFVGNVGYLSQTSFTSGTNFLVGFAPGATSPAQTIAYDNSNATMPFTLAFDAAGDLFMQPSSGFGIHEYTTPISAPTLTADSPFGFGGSHATTIDPAGVFIFGSTGNGTFAYGGPTHTSQISITPRTIGCCTFYAIANAVALDNNDSLYIAECGSSCGSYTHQGIDIFTRAQWTSCQSVNGCFSTYPTPTYIPTSDNPEGLAIDASGNLYTADFEGNAIDEFSPPYSSGSTVSNQVSGGFQRPGMILISP